MQTQGTSGEDSDFIDSEELEQLFKDNMQRTIDECNFVLPKKIKDNLHLVFENRIKFEPKVWNLKIIYKSEFQFELSLAIHSQIKTKVQSIAILLEDANLQNSFIKLKKLFQILMSLQRSFEQVQQLVNFIQMRKERSSLKIRLALMKNLFINLYEESFNFRKLISYIKQSKDLPKEKKFIQDLINAGSIAIQALRRQYEWLLFIKKQTESDEQPQFNHEQEKQEKQQQQQQHSETTKVEQEIKKDEEEEILEYFQLGQGNECSELQLNKQYEKVAANLQKMVISHKKSYNLYEIAILEKLLTNKAKKSIQKKQ